MLLTTPRDILFQIVCYIEPPEIGKLARTCKSVNQFITIEKQRYLKFWNIDYCQDQSGLFYQFKTLIDSGENINVIKSEIKLSYIKNRFEDNEINNIGSSPEDVKEFIRKEMPHLKSPSELMEYVIAPLSFRILQHGKRRPKIQFEKQTNKLEFNIFRSRNWVDKIVKITIEDKERAHFSTASYDFTNGNLVVIYSVLNRYYYCYITAFDLETKYEIIIKNDGNRMAIDGSITVNNGFILFETGNCSFVLFDYINNNPTRAFSAGLKYSHDSRDIVVQPLNGCDIIILSPYDDGYIGFKAQRPENTTIISDVFNNNFKPFIRKGFEDIVKIPFSKLPGLSHFTRHNEIPFLYCASMKDDNSIYLFYLPYYNNEIVISKPISFQFGKWHSHLEFSGNHIFIYNNAEFHIITFAF